jgi:hypothetical protein
MQQERAGLLALLFGGVIGRAPGSFDALWTVVNSISTLTTSRKITLSGVGVGATITAIGATEYSINGGAFTAAAGTISDDDKIQVRLVSSSSYETEVIGGVVIGGITCAFSVTTVDQPQVDGLTDESGLAWLQEDGTAIYQEG